MLVIAIGGRLNPEYC